MIQFLADENIPLYLVDLLRREGYDVFSVAEESPGDADSDILLYSLQSRRIILTEDHDFGELIFRDHRSAYGVILIRIPHTLPRDERKARMLTVVRQYQDEFIGAMVTITPANVRRRLLPQD